MGISLSLVYELSIISEPVVLGDIGLFIMV